MYVLQDTNTGYYLVGDVPLRGERKGERVLYFDREPRGCRWMTRKGAEAALERICQATKTQPEGMAESMIVVEVR